MGRWTREYYRAGRNPHQILNSKGQKLENRDEILKEYARYYKELLKVRPSENTKEEQIEQTVDKKFQEIIAERKIDRKIMRKTEIRKAIKGMNNKKAGDKNSWKAEWIKEGGSKMVHSLEILFNSVEEENKIPIQLRETKIKSVYKGGNKERIQESQRGIFLMNIVCKVYERVKKLQNENKQANISSMQIAGKVNRSTIDNLIIINLIIEKQRQDNKDTYILYADAEKYFDKLWLKDSLKEMERIGYDNSDIKIL